MSSMPPPAGKSPASGSPGRGGIFQSFGFLFSVQDLATPSLRKMQKTVDSVTEGIEKAIDSLSGKTTDLTKMIGGAFRTAAAAVVTGGKTLLSAMSPVFVAVLHGVSGVTNVLGGTVDVVVGFDQLITGVSESLASLLTLNIGGFFKNLAAAATGPFMMLDGAIRIISGIADGFTALIYLPYRIAVNGIKMIVNAATGLTKFAFGTAAKVIKTALTYAISGLKTVATTILGLLNPIKLVTKAMSLLQPLTSAFSRSISPAFDALTDAIDNALAPFSFLAELIAQDLMPDIMELLRPVTDLLVLGVVKLGVFLQGIVRSKGALGPVKDIFVSIYGALGKIFTAASAVVLKIWGPLSEGLKRLAPIAAKIFDHVGDFLAGVITRVGDLATAVLPSLITIIEGLWRTFAPLVEGVVKLGGALFDYVISPVVIGGLNAIAGLFGKDQSSAEEFFTAFKIGADKMAAPDGPIAKLGDNLDTMWVQFKADLGDTKNEFKGAIKDMWDSVTGTFGGAVDYVAGIGKGVWDWMHKWFSDLGESIARAFKSTLNTVLILPLNAVIDNVNNVIKGINNNALIDWISPNRKFDTFNTLTPFAKGGIVTGPTAALLGEAGPELVLPLKAEKIKEVMQPIISQIKLDMPTGGEALSMLSKAVELLEDIRTFLMPEPQKTEMHMPQYHPHVGDSDLSRGMSIAGIAH